MAAVSQRALPRVRIITTNQVFEARYVIGRSKDLVDLARDAQNAAIKTRLMVTTHPMYATLYRFETCIDIPSVYSNTKVVSAPRSLIPVGTEIATICMMAAASCLAVVCSSPDTSFVGLGIRILIENTNSLRVVNNAFPLGTATMETYTFATRATMPPVNSKHPTFVKVIFSNGILNNLSIALDTRLMPQQSTSSRAPFPVAMQEDVGSSGSDSDSSEDDPMWDDDDELSACILARLMQMKASQTIQQSL